MKDAEGFPGIGAEKGREGAAGFEGADDDFGGVVQDEAVAEERGRRGDALRGRRGGDDEQPSRGDQSGEFFRDFLPERPSQHQNDRARSAKEQLQHVLLQVRMEPADHRARVIAPPLGPFEARERRLRRSAPRGEERRRAGKGKQGSVSETGGGGVRVPGGHQFWRVLH